VKIKNISIASILIVFLLILNFAVNAVGKVSTATNVETTYILKQLMGRFGTLMAGIEIMQMKEKKPDWESIDWTLKELGQVLNQMQAIDKSEAYKKYTDVLAAGLIDLKNKYRKKDRNIYDGFGNLIQTCFQCHAMHRPADFLFPKDKPTAQTP
jgi:cytochrome c556